jgi:predicted DNA-binding transcriptional regulator AlpA
MTAVDDLDRFITLVEAADRLCMHKVTAWRLHREGRFPVPVQKVAGKNVVSLRLLVDFIHARAD